MHWYFFSRKLLAEKLPEFVGGQFLMKTKLSKEDRKRLMNPRVGEKNIQLIVNARDEERESIVLRGEILSLKIPNMSKKIVVVQFSWLCERHLFLKGYSFVPKWVLIPIPPKFCRSVKLEYTSFYFPKSGRRLKMFTTEGEFCRLYKPGDLDNLIQDGDEFVTFRSKLDFGK